MSEDYTDYFNESAPPEPEHEKWKGVQVPSSSPSAPSSSNEPEQVPVWVKLVDASDEVKQGYRPICVFMNEPPPVSFEYCFSVMGKWLAASFCWSMILGTIAGAFALIIAIFRLN